ncbi:TIR domain-containing protein [Serratia fonticola]|uniref:TIR domain-containing protein n=1 Tax=Serratia fonticola TaxID=47917 RepID=UPI0024DE75F6|nr:TIR domain-containing protein [Serratia fonticola]MDK2375056.1 nucleotide-binding protein [Serratia fonticola]
MDNDILNKLKLLNAKAISILANTTTSSSSGRKFIDNSEFIKWTVKAECLLLTVFGNDSTVYRSYIEHKDATSSSNVIKLSRLHAVTMAAEEEYENGLVTKSSAGVKVFIGHGRSSLWRELKDYISDSLGLPWDEFNRTPVAGLSTVTRLSEMLNNASIAFLIMTAEDEQSDGSVNARMNVVHEVGLFQGKLGFEKAIVLLEEGCSEFSNINGLGQVRFPKGNISAIFHSIREIMEREGVIK